mgnify:FL=1
MRPNLCVTIDPTLYMTSRGFEVGRRAAQNTIQTGKADALPKDPAMLAEVLNAAAWEAHDDFDGYDAADITGYVAGFVAGALTELQGHRG